MSRSRSRLAVAAASVASAIAVLALGACSASAPGSPTPTSTDSPSWDSVVPAPPDGRVIAVGTVMDVDGAVELCTGAIAESYPPQCSGIPLDDWSWDGVDGSESSGDTRWGSYAVTGTYDGERYTVTDPPIMLALYDPIAAPDPTGGVAGETPESDLQRVADELSESLSDDGLTVWTERGYVWLQVVWDDGSLQDAVDAAYGDGVVIVSSTLREID